MMRYSDEKESVSIGSIAIELNEMAAQDQKMRFDHQNPNIRAEFDPEIDRNNTSRLKEIVQHLGRPTISLVGEEASYAAWLIIQHADHDTVFQKKCLELMKKTPKGDVLLPNIAYLTDRVAVNLGKPQTYGTQFYKNTRGEIVPRPIRNPKTVEQRRKRMGLETFEVYTQKMKGLYTPTHENEKIGQFYKAT